MQVTAYSFQLPLLLRQERIRQTHAHILDAEKSEERFYSSSLDLQRRQVSVQGKRTTLGP